VDDATPAVDPELTRARACQETAGVLFEHPCPGAVHALCADCAKAICAQHGHDLEAGRVCTACARTQLADALRRGHRYGRFASEPLFFATYHYPGFAEYGPGAWGHDELQRGAPPADTREPRAWTI